MVKIDEACVSVRRTFVCLSQVRVSGRRRAWVV
jgi:hypothetical protein